MIRDGQVAAPAPPVEAEPTAAARDKLLAYVPRLLVDRLTRTAGALGPWEERFDAALMVADVSGFTKLSQLLAAKGPVGAEELSLALNQYFAKLVVIIEAHGGDIVRFAGDAPVTVFPAGRGGSSAAVVRATQCALALQAELHDYPTDAGPRLSMRAFVTAGPMVAMAVGGESGRYELLVGGPPWSDLSDIAALGEPGQVIVHTGAAAMAGGALEVAPLVAHAARVLSVREPLPAEPLAPVVPASPALAAVRAFVPGNVLHALDVGDDAWAAESRRVTVAFARLDGVDVTLPGALARTSDVFSAVQAAVYRYRGSINQFLFDDKGLVLLALWGIPTRTHEDDAIRATCAMLRVEEALKARGVGCAIGITTDRVFCGHRGGPSRREYAVIGTSVNLAARLMTSAG